MSLQLDGRVDLGRFLLDVAIECQPGETIALVGPNGSGKSTALNVLGGLLQLTEGSLTMDDLVLDRPADRVWVPPEARNVGMMFQDFLLFPHLSVIDNVAYGLRRNGATPEQAHRGAAGWLERFEVADLADARPGSLSGGQAQRVALARTLAKESRLLLLDEPLSALDSRTRLQVRCEIHRYLQEFEGYAVLVAHDVVDIMVLADRILILEDGRVAQVAGPDELQEHPRTDYAATLVGTNLLRGRQRGRDIEIAGTVLLPAPPATDDGPVDVVVAPDGVKVSLPTDSPRPGSWIAPISGMEGAGNEILLRIDGVVPLTARVSLRDIRDLHLSPGALIQVAVDPDRLNVFARHDIPQRV